VVRHDDDGVVDVLATKTSDEEELWYLRGYGTTRRQLLDFEHEDPPPPWYPKNWQHPLDPQDRPFDDVFVVMVDWAFCGHRRLEQVPPMILAPPFELEDLGRRSRRHHHLLLLLGDPQPPSLLLLRLLPPPNLLLLVWLAYHT